MHQFYIYNLGFLFCSSSTLLYQTNQLLLYAWRGNTPICFENDNVRMKSVGKRQSFLALQQIVHVVLMLFKGFSNHYLKPGPVNWSTFSAEYYVTQGVQWQEGFQRDMKIQFLF